MEQQVTCNYLKDALLAYFGREIQITESPEGCVLMLPQRTLDDRYPAVFIDRKTPDYFVVHDAGKTSSELFSQGIHITETREEAFMQMADRLGAIFADGVFRVGCKRDEILSAIVAIGQCEALGMWHIIGHKPDLSDVPVRVRVEKGVRAWNAPYPQRLEQRVPVKGRKANHVFDFVSYPDTDKWRPIALKILRPSDDSTGKAREYGFLAYDTENTIIENWHRLAILTKADRWTKPAKELVGSLSTMTVEVQTGEEEQLETLVPSTLDQIAA